MSVKDPFAEPTTGSQHTFRDAFTDDKASRYDNESVC